MIESPFYPHVIMFMGQTIPLSRLCQVWMLEYFPHTYPFCDLIFLKDSTIPSLKDKIYII